MKKLPMIGKAVGCSVQVFVATVATLLQAQGSSSQNTCGYGRFYRPTSAPGKKDASGGDSRPENHLDVDKKEDGTFP